LGPLLKALGLTIWGLVALGLLALFVVVGYQAAQKFRAPSAPVADTHSTNDQFSGGVAFTNPGSGTVTQTTPDQKNSVPASSPITADATRTRLRSAVDQHQYEAAVDYGKQLFDSGGAGPDDLLIIVNAYYSIYDCTNALTWVGRANDAFHAAGREPDESLHRIKMRCGSDDHERRISIRSEHMERTTRLLNSLKERAEDDRKNLPQLEADAAKSKSGNSDVRLGELYFGFGDYEHAITAIQRGLEKGRVTHLDDAYVYLGLAEEHVNNIAEARRAFAKLKEVPGISPRVLRLWELYAETRL
jgi:tetratricopeptide (TPR) repeat protein